MKGKAQELITMLGKALSMFQPMAKEPPPIEFGESHWYEGGICKNSPLICAIIFLMIIFATLMRICNEQNTQKHMKTTSGFDINLIIKNEELHLYIFKQLQNKLQCILQLIAWVRITYSMINKMYLKLPFQLYQTAKLQNQTYIRTCTLKNQLKKLITSMSQKINQQKLQFIKNGIMQKSNIHTSTQQFQSLDESESNQKYLRIKSHFQISRYFTIIRTRGYYSSILMFLLLIDQSIYIQVAPLPTCNSFPKIFGASGGSSHFFHIDVYNDYLAMGGDIRDSQLAGISSITDYMPCVALQSISTGRKIYWAKVLTLKNLNSIWGVQFSTDGLMLIAHAYSLTNSFLIVFDVSNGSILSARKYSSGGQDSYNYRIKSMQVSSGVSPMAYVLSNYQAVGSYIGQHLFKFDPISILTPSVWVKKTIGNSQNNFGHQGLVFGRSESLLYAFSWYNGSSTVSFLDADGNSKWQYATPDGGQNSNKIEYYQINSAYDMIIATSGSSYINYNRIISLGISPYSAIVPLTQTFRDPSSSSSKQLYGLYIKDENNAVSLIYDSSSKITKLAAINFKIPQISYENVFPRIELLQSVVFTSPTVYYAACHHNIFYTDQTSYKTLSTKYQWIVYSSDMTTTSCYSMPTIASTTPINMVSLAITPLSSTIYEPSIVTFYNDTNAYTTVEINQSIITQIPWCVSNQFGPFTVDNVTQTTTTFTSKSLISVQFRITPFQTTQNCGSYANTWTYTVVNNFDRYFLKQTTNKISVDSMNGSIFVQSMQPGIYSIKVIGTLPDLVSKYSSDFTIIITEVNPPYFTEEKPQNQKVLINYELYYRLPSFEDPEGYPVCISVEPNLAKSFITIQDKTLKFAPKYSFQLGTTNVTIILANEYNSSKSYFNVTVIQRPYFIQKLQKLDIPIMSSSKYSLPVKSDSNYYVLHSFLPNFVNFVYPDYFLNPEKASDIGNFIINGELCDENAKTQFQIKLIVTNQAPYLKETKIQNLRITIKSEQTLNISEGVDREGQKIKYEANERNKQSLPSFIKFNPDTREFKIQPTKLDALKDYHIELSLIDNFKARTIYSFDVTIYDPLKLFQNSTNSTKNVQMQLTKIYLSAKIQSINPYGLIVIKFYDTLDTPLLINNASLKFNSTNMDVRLKPYQDQNKQNQNKSISQWKAINLTTTQLIIQVNFSDPAQISQKISQEDKIEITFNDGQLFKSTNGGKSLPDNYVLISGLPRQIVLTKQIASISEMISGGSKAMTYLVIGNIALQLFMSFSMHLLWGMMNNLQLMGKMLKFNVDVPSNAYIFFKYIEEFLSMKAKFIEDYLEKFNNYIMKTTGTSGESDKDANRSIIKNLGTIILGSVALVIAMIVTAILIKYSRNPLVMKITNALKNKLFFNSILRTGVQSYMQFSIIAFSFLDSKKDNTTLATGLSFLCLAVFFLIFAHMFLRKNLSSLSEPKFQQRFSSLYLNIDTNIPHSYLLTTIFLSRRFLLGIILSFCDDHQDVQFFYMNFTSFLIIIYLVKVRPLVSNYLNVIEIFNEVILYGCTGLIWGMTDYQGGVLHESTSEEINAAYNSKKNQIGWAYIIMASTTIVTTIGGIIINCLRLIRTKLREKCQNKNKAVKVPIIEKLSTRRQDYALQKQDNSTMIQDNSIVSEINQKHQSRNKIQEDPSQQFEEEFKLDDPDSNDPNIDDSSSNHHGFNNEDIQPPKYDKQACIDALARLNRKLRQQKESMFIKSSELNENFEEMKDIFNNIQGPAKQVPPPQQKPLIKDIFVTSQEIQSIFKQ